MKREWPLGSPNDDFKSSSGMLAQTDMGDHCISYARCKPSGRRSGRELSTCWYREYKYSDRLSGSVCAVNFAGAGLGAVITLL